MINKKLLCGLLCVIFVFSTLSVSAASFSDVENDPGVAWAKTYINKMADKGYIKGYEDGTFKPNNTISKTEALILLSRMLGVNDKDFEESVEFAVKEYSSVLSEYNTKYENEVAFLLYTGVLKVSDLDDYISSSNKNAPLKRYQAAILLTKLLGAEEEVQSNVFVSSSYADTVEIPDSARAYVEFVKEKGIMQGMGNNADGQPEFWPNTAVTRSQMAKMLYTLIDVIDLSVETGTVVSIDTAKNTITISINGNDILNKVSSITKFKINGSDVKLRDMVPGMKVQITHAAGVVSLIENNSAIKDDVIYGLVSSTRDTEGTRYITIADANDSKKTETYVLADNAKIRVNGAIDLFSKVKANNYVGLTVEDGYVTVLEVVEKTATKSGTLITVDATGEYTVLSVMNNSGNTETYEISADGVTVVRNSKDATLGDLLEGDALVIKLTYGKVTKITATSKNTSFSGTISAITHTISGSYIEIQRDNETTQYKVNKDVKVSINSTENGTVYDIRPGADARISLQSSEVVSIETSAVAVKTQIIGVIKTVNVDHGVIVVEEDGVDYNVYCRTSTNFIDSLTGKSTTLKAIKNGRPVIITGSTSTGFFVATAVVLQ